MPACSSIHRASSRRLLRLVGEGVELAPGRLEGDDRLVSRSCWLLLFGELLLLTALTAAFKTVAAMCVSGTHSSILAIFGVLPSHAGAKGALDGE